jgi:hypothetical protein
LGFEVGVVAGFFLGRPRPRFTGSSSADVRSDESISAASMSSGAVGFRLNELDPRTTGAASVCFGPAESSKIDVASVEDAAES